MSKIQHNFFWETILEKFFWFFWRICFNINTKCMFYCVIFVLLQLLHREKERKKEKKICFILKEYTKKWTIWSRCMHAQRKVYISQSLISITIYHAWRVLCTRACIVLARGWAKKRGGCVLGREHEICFSSPRIRGSNFVVVHNVPFRVLCTRSVHFPGLPTERTLPLALIVLFRGGVVRALRSCLSFNLFLSSHFQSLEYTSECWRRLEESRRQEIESVDTFPLMRKRECRTSFAWMKHCL